MKIDNIFKFFLGFIALPFLALFVYGLFAPDEQAKAINNWSVWIVDSLRENRPSAESPPERFPDKMLVQSYDATVMEFAKVIDDLYLPFGEALQKLEGKGEAGIIEALVIAKRIKMPIANAFEGFKSLHAPTLVNEDADKMLKSANKYLVSAYWHKSNSVDEFLKFGDSSSTMMGVVAGYTNEVEAFQAQMFSGMYKLTAAKQIVGIELTE